ncbi:unnamed protein product [Moneuplotes crassus]|uniref:Uncharacterized protein n=1 Tax=Euplotes crassus TaxID=5936 RepID=A0AAD1XPY8_EUPCR|nr:unnamed protein product [Moneuplotes crassus]
MLCKTQQYYEESFLSIISSVTCSAGIDTNFSKLFEKVLISAKYSSKLKGSLS